MSKKRFWRFALSHARNPIDAINLVRFGKIKLGQSLESSPTDFQLRYRGRDVTVSLRKGTTDIYIFIEVFRDETYKLPEGFKPKVIVDIGGNIGLSALFFSILYPEASIHVFEPIPDNLKVLQRNLDNNHLQNVHVHPYGLGKQDQVLTLSTPGDGNYATFSRNAEIGSVTQEVPIRNVVEVFEELGLNSIDLLKVDCEGAEVEILPALESRLGGIDVILAEVHPTFVDPEAAYGLLPLLCRTHHLDHEKKFGLEAFHLCASKRPWKSYR